MNTKEKIIDANEKADIQSWVLPGITGESINSKHNKLVQYVDAAQEEAERERKIQEELQRGFQEGLVKGQVEGANAQDKIYQTKIKELVQIMSAFQQGFIGITNQLESELPFQVSNVVLSIAQAVIKAEVQTNKNLIVQTIKDALMALPKDLTNIKCILNPQDITTLKEIDNPELKEYLDKFELIADETISQGGCFIKTLSSTLDATLESRVLDIFTKITDEHKNG